MILEKMNALHFLLFGIIMCSVYASARHHGDRSTGEIEQDDYSIDSDESVHKHNHAKDRHRRKRYQPFHSYHYPVPQTPFYYPERREDSLDLTRVIHLLEEIAHNVRQPQTTSPPIVYIPYVPYNIPTNQNCNCPNGSVDAKGKPEVTFPSRIKPTIEENQNWGFVEKTASKNDDTYEDDFSRPISFKPMQRPQHFNRPQPKVDHGTSQAGETTTEAPLFESEGRIPGWNRNCIGPLISCCMETNKQLQLNCLTRNECEDAFADGSACQRENIIELLKIATTMLAQRHN